MQVEKILKEINKRDIQTRHWEPIKENKGANSRVYRVTGGDQKKYALKLYKSFSRDDPRNRLKAECDFLMYAKDTPASLKVPQLIASDADSNWSLLSWLDGEELKAVNEEHLTQIANFISDINQNPINQSMSLQAASEAILNQKIASEILQKRIKKLITVKPKNDTEEKTLRWIKEILIPECKKQLSQFKKYNNSKSWQSEAMQIIASPSDVGIHNTIVNGGLLYFLDFEYAGLDDLAKFACDWVLQPEYPLDVKSEKYFIQSLKKRFNKKPDCWFDRYINLKPILKLKWCTIMLNDLLNHNINEKKLAKIIEYFEIANA